MADKRISQLIERTDIANNDVLPIVANGATTTNKVTISTIQDWMQDNLDVGVTSVGLTLGTTGTDVNVTGSPITTSGNITINIPTASATNRGLLSSADWTTFNNKQASGNYVTIDTNQSITGIKTFTNSILLKNSPSLAGFILQSFSPNALEFGATISGTTYYSSITFPAGSQNWNLPNASGTLALTSDIPSLAGYVTLGTAQTITAQKTFSTSGSSDTAIINHGSGSGIALNITKAGNGEGLRVAKTSGSGNAVTITGGTLSAEAATLTGLTVNSGNAVLNTNFQTGTSAGWDVNTFFTGGNSGAEVSLNLGYAGATSDTFIKRGSNGRLDLGTGATARLTLASTGAATFSSSVTATANASGRSGLFGGASFGVRIDNSGSFNNGGSTIHGVDNTFVASYQKLSLNGSSLEFMTDYGTKLTIANSGAATFSSSVTAGAGTFAGTAGNASPFFTLNATSANATFNWVSQAFASNLAAGNNLVHFIGQSGSTKNSAYLGFKYAGADSNDNILTLGLYGVDNVLNINGSGNVGIGTASPGAPLEVRGGTGANFRVRNNGSNNLLLQNYNDTDFYRNLQIAASTIQFLTGTEGGNSATERMRITSGGAFKASNSGNYVNATAPYHELRQGTNETNLALFTHTAASPYGPDISFTGAAPNNTTNYFLICSDTSVSRFVIYSNGNVANTNNSYGAISDIKLKENITDASPKLEDLLKVKVRNYNLIGEETKQIGVIAQELEEVFPAMVDESEDFEEVEVPQLDEEGNEVLNEEGEVVTTKEKVSKGTTTKSVKYSVFVPMLIKAIQEQQEQIDSLKNQIK
jgi:hypothetical protein